MIIFIGLMTWVLFAAVCYLVARRAISNFADPLLVENITIPFSAALLAVLSAKNLITVDKLGLFSLVLLGYLLGARVAAAFFGRNEFRRALISTLSRFSSAEVTAILCVAAFVTLVMAVLAIQAGAQGDARQDFGRAFRPLVLIQSGIFSFALVLLLSPTLTPRRVFLWFTLLISLSIAFSGKSVAVPVFFWFGLRMFVHGRRARLGTLALLVGGVIAGVGVMGVLAYGTNNLTDLFVLIVARVWMSGDVYIYSYQQHALDLIRGDYQVSFLAYIFHPITSLVGIRGYEKPLGSMLMSEVLKRDVLTGPNPQLPVLMDFFFPDQIAAPLLIAFTIGLLVIGIRAAGIWAATGRSRYMALGGLTVAIFSPSSGFVDTSRVLISVVGIAAVTVFLVIIEMTAARPARVTDISGGVSLSR